MWSEIELKLSIEQKSKTRLLNHPAIVNACIEKPVTHKIISIYYDTPDLKLLNAGVSLRVRHSCDRWIQSIKTVGNSLTGLHRRLEWEDLIAANHPDFTKILDPVLTQLFADKKLRAALMPLFQTEIRRTEWQLAFDNGDKIALSLDLGQLTAGINHESISEIELELKAGNVGRIFDLALELHKTIPLTLENVSKGLRGYAYYRTSPQCVFKGNLPKLVKNTDSYSAFKKIAWECINHLQSNQEMVLNGTDVEGVHQMRVALRRLRSAFSLFKKILWSESSIALLAELGWLSEVLGKARDIDVFVTQTLPAVILQFKNHAGLLKLRNQALTAQIEAYVKVRTALSSQRYNYLLLSLAAWLENEGWREGGKDKKKHRVLDIATTNLTKCHKRLLQRGKHLEHLHPEARHKARIAAKKMRYASEFFASLYPSTKSRSFIKNLSQLQDCLGLLNDITITEKLLQQLIGTTPDSNKLDEVQHLFTHWNASNKIHFEANLNKNWLAFVSQKPFWI